MKYKVHHMYYKSDGKRLIRLLEEGYVIVRSDSTRDKVVYILEKK